ncbi:MAG: phosphate/phosphite/phosphonate ABC transporter substrate-binding protein [Thiobacillaceae bacterium]
MPTFMHRLAPYLSLIAVAALPVWATASEPLKIGLLPTLSTRTLITNYQPLRAYLERELKRPVVLLTAADFQTFHQDTVAGAFDLVLTAAHLARLAQTRHGMQPLATYRATNRALLVAAKSRPVDMPAALRGRNLAIFDPIALNVLHALNWLKGQGLEAGRDYQVLLTPSHNSVAHSVINGESILGVTSPAGLRQLPADMRQQLQVYAELPPGAALIWLAHPRLAGQADHIKSLLLRFAESPEGRQFMANTGYIGLREVSTAELEGLDPYAKEVARLLHDTP